MGVRFFPALRYAEGIKKARVGAELSKGELARRIGVVASCITRFESGKSMPSLTSFEMIAAACDLTPVDLMWLCTPGETATPPPDPRTPAPPRARAAATRGR